MITTTGRRANALRVLRNGSALAYCTGAESVLGHLSLALTTPMPSSGEDVLWRAAESIAAHGYVALSEYDLTRIDDASRDAVRAAQDVLTRRVLGAVAR